MKRISVALFVSVVVLVFFSFAGCNKTKTINVKESISVTDSPQTSQSAAISIIETIGVADSPGMYQSAAINQAETINVTDSPSIAPSILISLVETIIVSASPTVIPGQGEVTVTVISPKAASVLPMGSTQNISWKTTGKGIAYAGIYYSTDGGKSMIPISQIEPDDGTYTWKVPQTPSKTVLVRVIAYNVDDEVLALADSGVFTISSQ
jgi:hypothetical protein